LAVETPHLAQRIKQRPEQIAIAASSADRSIIERLVDLRGAGALDRTLGLVERQAGLIPREAAVSYYTPRLSLEIGDKLLVSHLEHHTFWENCAPMIH
jgi:hypothetical protein